MAKGEKCFENLFAAAKATQSLKKNQKKLAVDKMPEESTDTEIIQRGSDKGKQLTEDESHNPRKNNSGKNSQSVENHSQLQSDQPKPRKHHSLSRKNSIRESRSSSNHSESLRHRSRSRSRSRSNHLEAQTVRSNSHNNRSLSRSRSNSRTNNRSRSSSSQSKSLTIHSRSRSGSSCSSAHTNRSRSRSSRSRSHSNNLEAKTVRSNSHNNRSLSRSRSSSRTNRSRSSSSQSKSPTISSRSRSGSSRSSHTNHSESRRYGSHASRYDSEAARNSNLASGNRSTNINQSSKRSSSNLISGRDRSRRQSRSPLVERPTQATNEIDGRKRKRLDNKKDSAVTSKEQNKIRVEALYRAHRQQREGDRSQNLSASLSSRHHPTRSETTQSNNDTNLLGTLLEEVRELKKIVIKNERRFVESDRRLTRLEVTVNKSFIVLGDLSNAINARMALAPLQRESKPPNGFRVPKLPVKRLRDLIAINKDFQNDDVFNFMVSCSIYSIQCIHSVTMFVFQVNKEKEFCTHSSATDTVTMTAYLKRFISVDLRASLVLKDLKGEQGLTLYHDFHKVYEFLREVMKSGYQIKNKILTNKDVHVVLRTVWGRSKQALAGEANKRR